MIKLIRWLKSLFTTHPYRVVSHLPEPTAKLSFVFDIDMSKLDNGLLVGDQPTVTILPRNNVSAALIQIANDEVINAIVNVASLAITDYVVNGKLKIVMPLFITDPAEEGVQPELLN